jgi:putative heme-binding domain-containing protein
MPEGEAKAIVAFLQSFQARAEEERIAGDPEIGRQLFFGSGQCSRCHMYGGRGGRLGPDLSSVRNEKKASDLRKATTHPDDHARVNFDPVEVEFNDGRVLRGIAKNQDTFSIQILDEEEKLHLLLKRDLKQVTPSPMLPLHPR